MLTPLLFSLALVQGHPQDLARGGHISVGVGIGVGGRDHGHDHGHVNFDFSDRYMHRRGYDYGRRVYYAPAPVHIHRPVYVDRPVYVEPPPAYAPAPAPQTVIVEKPVEKVVTVEKPVEKTVTVDRVIERTIFVEGKKTTILEKVDGQVKSITHAPSEAKKLDANAEMALLCNIRDEINRRLPLEVASVRTKGQNRFVEVTFRATKFSPYDRVTRRYEINANTLAATGGDLTIHFNADAEGIADLGSDFQDLLFKMGSECQATGGDWYLDNKFDAEPKQENGKLVKTILADMDAPEKK